MNRDLGLTFAGGGNRAFYQMGLLKRWHQDLLPRTAAVSCCSAGACIIAVYLSGRDHESLEYWKWRRRDVHSNFQWGNLLRGKNPAPHGPIYRDTLLHALKDGGLDRIRERPFPVFVLCARLPPLIPSILMAGLGLAVYITEKSLKPLMVHPSITPKFGFRAFAYDARDCETPQQLANLIMASSATPPFTPVGRFKGLRLLDGGLIDNVPAFVCENQMDVERTLVFMTRPYPPQVLGIKGRRLYLAPIFPIPVDRWDYTQPHLIERTIRLGEIEADSHQSLLDEFLSPAAAMTIA